MTAVLLHTMTSKIHCSSYTSWSSLLRRKSFYQPSKIEEWLNGLINPGVSMVMDAMINLLERCILGLFAGLPRYIRWRILDQRLTWWDYYNRKYLKLKEYHTNNLPFLKEKNYYPLSDCLNPTPCTLKKNYVLNEVNFTHSCCKLSFLATEGNKCHWSSNENKMRSLSKTKMQSFLVFTERQIIDQKLSTWEENFGEELEPKIINL